MGEITLLVLGKPEDPVVQRVHEVGADVHIKIARTSAELAPECVSAPVMLNWLGGAEFNQLVAASPHLEWIHTRHAGVDAALTPSMLAHPAILTNGSGVFSPALGEFVMAGALYFAKDFARMLRSKAEKRWQPFLVEELSRQTIGIIGYGDIGQAIARRARAFGMRVLAVRRDPSPRPGDEFVNILYPSSDLHQMLAQCDYAVVAAPLTPETRHMVGAAEFHVMKPTAIMMNVGRGPVIDEAALVAALQAGRIRGACLDVFAVEPLPPESPLWQMENVFISAHTADQTHYWMQDAMDFFLAQFARWRRGEPLQNIVDKHKGY